MRKETHLRYDGEVFAEEGERADSLYARGPWFILFSGVKLKVSAWANGLANMEWKPEVVLEGTLACYQSQGASGVDLDRSFRHQIWMQRRTCNVYIVQK